MLVKDRPRLTMQCLRTLFVNSSEQFNLTIVDDCSNYVGQGVYEGFLARPNVVVLRVTPACEVTGRLRNLGVYFSEKHWGRGDWLYLSDNDAYFTPGWDSKLTRVFEQNEERFKLLGAYRHPYHQPRKGEGGEGVVSTDAVQGLGHLMRWETWDKYGPLDSWAKGTNQSEDFKFCQDIGKDGFLVGSIQPEVVHNCGLTGTNGKPSPGAEVMVRIPGIVME